MSGGRALLYRLHRRFLRRERSLLDELQLEQRRRADDFLRARDVGDAGQLHQNLVGRALPGHDRLGDAQLVDPALDGLERLRDGLLPELASRCSAASCRCSGPRRTTGRTPYRPQPPPAGTPGRSESLRRRTRSGLVTSSFAYWTPAVAQRLAQPLDGRFGLDPQRGVGLHAHDQVHAALQVEAEIDLLLGG